jgi:DNA-binding NtrC family response regulator
LSSRILVVHSSDPAAAAIASVLRDAGYDAYSVGTFDAALKEVTTRCPDLLVTSVRLGSFNGLHLSLRCHVVHPELPILVMGIGSDATLANEAIAYDVRFIVSPPTSKLLATVRDMLASAAAEPKVGDQQVSRLHGGNSTFTYQ